MPAPSPALSVPSQIGSCPLASPRAGHLQMLEEGSGEGRQVSKHSENWVAFSVWVPIMFLFGTQKGQEIPGKHLESVPQLPKPLRPPEVWDVRRFLCLLLIHPTQAISLSLYQSLLQADREIDG